MGIVISIGKWGGIYVVRGTTLRICLGFIALSFFNVDGDRLIQAAANWGVIRQAVDNDKAVLVEKRQNEYFIDAVEIIADDRAIRGEVLPVDLG